MNSDGSSSTAESRPRLDATKTTASYLQEFQRCRAPHKVQSHPGIDTVDEGLPVEASDSLAHPQVPSTDKDTPPTDNPPSLDLSCPNGAPPPGTSSYRLVATLFYKSKVQRIPSIAMPPQPPMSLDSKPSKTASEASEIPANMAATANPSPFEPQTVESEVLEEPHSSYISPLCITSFLHLVSTLFLAHGSENMSSTHRCLDDSFHPLVVELILSPAPVLSCPSLKDLRKHELIYRFEREWNVDVAFQHDLIWRRHPRLVVFDMDSTLITQEVIDLLAATITNPPDLAGKVADITHRAMLGELPFESAFRERVALLRGLPESIFTELREALELTNGVRPLIKALKRLGVRTAVLSGGFQPLTEWLAGQLAIEHAHANEVVIEDGKLTGQVKGIIVGRERKAELLIQIVEREGIDLSQVVAVGDGANDLRMMAIAGLGVAWNAKTRVQLEADVRLNGETLLDLLYLFGCTREEIEMLSA